MFDNSQIPQFNLRNMSNQMLWTLNGLAAKRGNLLIVGLTASELKYRTRGVR